MNKPTIKIAKNIADFKGLLWAYEDAFDWENFQIPKEDYLEKIIRDEHCILLIAKQNNEVIGGLTAYLLHNYQTAKSMIYIYDFGVKKAFQNQGIGIQIIDFLKQYALDNDIEEIFVSTEQNDNEQALAFYRKSGISEEFNTVNFNYFRRPATTADGRP